VNDGVNAQHGIEATSFIGQRPAAITNGKSRPVSEPARGGLGLGLGNPSILDINTRKPASDALDKSQGRATRTAADIKNMAGLAYAEKVRDLGSLRGSAPILLADVLPIDFAPQFGGELAVSVGKSGAVKVRAALMLLDHFSPPGGTVTDHLAAGAHPNMSAKGLEANA
jgi:hypothetical protein